MVKGISISEDLISKLYNASNFESLEKLLRTKEFSSIKDSIQIITDHKKPLKYFKFNKNQYRRTDATKVQKTNNHCLYLIEILNWDSFNVNEFKKKFQGCFGVLVLLSKELGNPIHFINDGDVYDEEKEQEFDPNHTFSHLIDGLGLKVIVQNNVQDFTISGKTNPTNISFPNLKQIKLENVQFVNQGDKLDLPKLKEVTLSECSQEVLESINLETLTSLDVTTENQHDEGIDEVDPIGDCSYQLNEYKLPNLIWGNFRNFYCLQKLELPKIENMLLLTVPSPTGEQATISKINAPKLNELTIEFWKGFPNVNEFQIPNLKSIKLTNIIGNHDEDQEVFKNIDDLNLDPISHVSHWELYNAVGLLSNNSNITKNIEILNITTFKDEEDQYLSQLSLPNLKVLSLNRSNTNGKIPKVHAPSVSNLSISFQEVFENLDNLTAENFPNLKELRINNLTGDVINDIPETVFKHLESLEINGSLFKNDCLSKLQKWTFPNLKTFKYEINSVPQTSLIKINFKAPKVEDFSVKIIDTSYDEENENSINLEITDFPSLKKLEIEGIKSLGLSKINNLQKLTSLPDSPIDSIIADDLSNLLLLEYEHTESTNPSEIEQIKKLNKKVERKITSLGNFMVEEGDLEMFDEVEDFTDVVGGNDFYADDIEEEY